MPGFGGISRRQRLQCKNHAGLDGVLTMFHDKNDSNFLRMAIVQILIGVLLGMFICIAAFLILGGNWFVLK